MIVKVNRVNNINEIQRLKRVGVDIIGISLKLNTNNNDSRALTIEEIQNIQEQIEIPNLSINLNLFEYRNKDIISVSQNLKPKSLNLFKEASSHSKPELFNKALIESIETINNSKLDLIAFGNGFGYDGPSQIPNTLGVYENLKLMEVNIDTLSPISSLRIKNKKEWANFMNIDESDVKQEECDTMLESIIESMQGRPFLVDDKNLEDVPVDKLLEIGAKGITVSLVSLVEDEYSKNQSHLNCIASPFELNKIIEITKRIKEYEL